MFSKSLRHPEMECKEMISGYIVDPSMQHFIGNVVWDEARLISRYHSMASDDLGDADGVLIFDESGFVKKGNDSVGVARQY